VFFRGAGEEVQDESDAVSGLSGEGTSRARRAKRERRSASDLLEEVRSGRDEWGRRGWEEVYLSMLPGELFELTSCSVWLDRREEPRWVWTALYMWTECGHWKETDLSVISVRSIWACRVAFRPITNHLSLPV
jgi:hypothetical protein